MGRSVFYVGPKVLDFPPNTRSTWDSGTYKPRIIQIREEIQVDLIGANFTVH